MHTAPPRSSLSKPQFMEFNGRRLFALQIMPVGACTGAVLYLPPFAEEMNRCRTHVVAQARALAAAGVRCLLLDHHGTGESDGRIVDAHWDLWLADALAAADWLARDSGHPVTVWGVRTGALLAAELATCGRIDIPHLLFWQPVLDGQLFLNQYLRLRIASQLVNETDRETTDQIRARMAAGEVIEVAGYPLAAAMADSLARRRMSDFNGLANCRISWLDVVGKPGQQLSVPSRRLVDTLQQAGARIAVAAVACPMIWQLHERADAPELTTATLALMEFEP